MSAPLAETFADAPAASADVHLDAGLNPIAPGYRHVIRLMVACCVVPLVIGAGVLEFILTSDGILERGAIIAPALALGVFVLVFLPERKWRRWGYSGSGNQLRVARGWMFRTDTIVPFRRIQHIDVGQGPLERLFGLASLTVHTAGTHNSIVTLPGLIRADAEALRDTMRLHIRRESE